MTIIYLFEKIEFLKIKSFILQDQANPCEGRNDKINENIEPKMESSENVGAVGEQMQFNDIPCKCPGLMDYNNKRFFIQIFPYNKALIILLCQ